jgi:pyridinium-3,5-biscarboxylic acid mononucleotide synthase
MTPTLLRSVLEDVRQGRLSPEQAEAQLAGGDVAELDFATLDLERSARLGFPEVIFGEGKSSSQILEIVRRLEPHPAPVLVTRISKKKGTALCEAFPTGEWRPEARAFALRRTMPPLGPVAIVTAGTSDLPVAEEASFTAEVLGCEVIRVVDVGVAGVHRLLRKRAEIARARVAVVIAGMEGALPTAVGGLVGIPIVAVPTSIGYGANLGGMAALLGMLNSCSPNVAVVNIDNGFGAAFYAALIARSVR